MRAPSPLTMRQALTRVAKAGGSIRWYLEHAENNHRLTGRPYATREEALADPRLPDFPGYSPAPYLAQRGYDVRWVTGQGRAGNDHRVAIPYTGLTKIAR